MRTTLLRLLVACSFLALNVASRAQEPEDLAPPPPGPGMRGHKPLKEMVEQWLEQLRKRDPAEYERLTQLRQDDPEAFREELEQRLQRERARKFLERYPALKDAIDSMPEKDQQAVLRRLGAMPPGPGGPGTDGRRPGPGRGPGPGDGPPRPEIEKLQQEVGALARAYREASSEDARQGVRGELKTKLSALFDLREAQRREELARFESHAADVKKKLEKRAANKETIIEKRLQELTGAEDLAW
jgi:hypothetical protein